MDPRWYIACDFGERGKAQQESSKVNGKKGGGGEDAFKWKTQNPKLQTSSVASKGRYLIPKGGTFGGEALEGVKQWVDYGSHLNMKGLLSLLMGKAESLPQLLC